MLRVCPINVLQEPKRKVSNLANRTFLRRLTRMCSPITGCPFLFCGRNLWLTGSKICQNKLHPWKARPTCRYSGHFPSRELFIVAGGIIAAALETNEPIRVYNVYLARNGLLNQ